MTSNEERKERDFYDLLLWKLTVFIPKMVIWKYC